MHRLFFHRVPLFCIAVLFILGISVFAQDKDWRPVTPDELSGKKPLVEPDADAEATFWEVRIDDSSDENLSLRHYVRVKIFTERGREKYSKFDVPFSKGIKIKDIAARVIRPDNSIVEIKKEDIFEREIIKADGLKVKAKSFAVPNIEPGVIIEYKYREEISDAGAKGMRLLFQRDIPVQKMAYYYKPYNGNPPRYQPYNFTDTQFVKDKGGYWLASRTDVPAMKDEPKMPPEDSVRAWMLLTGASISTVNADAFSIVYTVKVPGVPSLYWGAVGTENAPITKLMIKGSSEIKKAAADITAGAATPEEKLKKIYEYCQSQITNTTYDPTITDDQRAKLPATSSFGDVMKRKSTNYLWVNLLFGALASANGFDSRIAFINDRSKMFFDPKLPNMTNDSLLHPGAVAVKVENGWKFFDPGVKFLPYGMLTWNEEDTWALLVGEKQYQWEKTPFTGYESSVTKRDGKFTLLEDGTLEGDVTMELKGQPALSYRMENYDEALSKLEDDLSQEVKHRISVAEVSKVSVENLLDPSKPLVQKFKVRVPNYAQKTGKRLFLQPSFFEYGKSPLFSSATRQYDMFFRYPWSELDNIEIKLPAGYDLDNAEAPSPVSDPQNIGSLVMQIAMDNADNTLVVDRKFHFGGGGNVLFGSGAYKPVKSLFDLFSKTDAHTITLKQK
ncbi:MAG: DUF3857 domain-containing protein [Acidobacteriota bacterium]